MRHAAPPIDKKIEGTDENGNVWKILFGISSPNRYKLSFVFNTKEYVLSRFPTAKGANDTWDLLEMLNKKKTREEEPKSTGIANKKKQIEEGHNKNGKK